MNLDFEKYMNFLMGDQISNQFKPTIYYSKFGDQLEIYWKNDLSYSEQTNIDGKAQFSLHRSMETNEIVGITLYSIKHRLKKESMLAREPERQRMDKEFEDRIKNQV